jgi:hypothetical protein
MRFGSSKTFADPRMRVVRAACRNTERIAQMNLVSVIVGLIALALAVFVSFGGLKTSVAALGWLAVGVAALGVLLACVQFRRPSRKTGLVIAGFVFAVAASVMVFWQKHAMDPKKETDIPTKRLLKLHNAYYQHDEDQDSGWFSAEIENISGKTISAFEAKITLRVAKGEVLQEESVSYLEPLEKGKKLFVFTHYLNTRLGYKGSIHTEQSFEKMCTWAFGLDEISDASLADLHKKFAKARHTGKSKLTCTYIKTE